MENNENTNQQPEYLGSFNLNQDTVHAAVADFVMKNSEELQTAVKQAEENNEAINMQVRWHSNNNFAELHLFKTQPTDTTDVVDDVEEETE
jgi:hypothetical protein